MAATIKFSTFAGGEVTPELHGRTDLERLRGSLRTCRNFILTPTGAAKNRPGTTFVAECKDTGDDAHVIRLIPFVFNSTQSYVIEVGELYMRFHSNGAAILTDAQETGSHTGADSATVLDASGGGTPFAGDDYVGARLENISDGSSGIIISHTDSTATVVALAGGNDNTWQAADSFILYDNYEIATPWSAEDVFKLRFVQLNDVMTITHRDRTFPPYELKRFGETDWRLTAWSVTRPVNPPASVTVTGEGGSANHPTTDFTWAVTAVDEDGNESLPTVDTPADIAVPGSAAATGLPSVAFTAPASGNTPNLYNIYRGRQGVYGYVGSADDTPWRDDARVPDYSDNPPTEENPLEIMTTASAGALRTASLDGSHEATKGFNPESFDDNYKFYYHLVVAAGESITLGFDVDTGGGWDEVAEETLTVPFGFPTYDHDRTKTIFRDGMNSSAHKFRINIKGTTGSPTLTSDRVEWSEASTEQSQTTYPAVVTYHESRLVFASFELNPAQIRASKVGIFKNFDKSFTIKDDDAYDFTIASSRYDEIRWLVSRKNALLIGTAGAIYLAGGGDGGPLTPTSVDIAPRVFYPAGWLAPLEVGNSVLYYSERGRVVREFLFDPTGAIPSEPRDLTVLARHLLRDYDIIDWAYADEPSEICWAVRDDGTMLGLTYLREHNVWGWHRHETRSGDFFESVASVPEGRESATYVIVKRDMGGATPKRFVEKIAERETANDPQMTVLLDCAITSDNRVNRVAPDEAYTDPRLRLEGGSTWAAGESMTLQAESGSPFTPSDVGIQYELVEPSPADPDNPKTVRVDVTGYTDTDTLTVEPVTAVPTELRTQYTYIWGRAYNSFEGLAHLEGQTVTMTVDGGTHATKVVTNGVVTLDASVFAQVIHVGLPYTCDLETLPLWFGSDGALRKKTPVMVGAEVDSWAGLWIGQHLNDLVEAKQRMVSEGYGTVNPKSGLTAVRVRNTNARHIAVALQQQDPLPVTILSVIVLTDIGDE